MPPSEQVLPEARIGPLLQERGWRIATAESCTGGLVLSRLTDISGSSAYVIGGVGAYANEVKLNLLGVTSASLIQHGAVSEVIAAEMAIGIRRLLGTEVGISVTGIAGPGGGSVEKPVGLTFIGLSTPDLNLPRVIRRQWDADRTGNKQLSADAALWLVIDYLEGRTSPTR